MTRWISADDYLNSLLRVRECRDAISNIPPVEILTLDDKDYIDIARSLYDSLSAEEKKKVINYQTLLNAEETIKSSGWTEVNSFFYLDSEDSNDLQLSFRLVGQITKMSINDV